MNKQIYPSPLGDILLLASEKALLGIYFVGQKYEARGYEEVSFTEASNAVLDKTKKWLDAYFAGECPDSKKLLIEAKGTAFQKQVWQEIANIPYGQTRSYTQIAEAIDCRSPRAVGGAIGKNPLSILVPCHRILGSGGKMTGYAGGVERKIWLLEHEKRS